MKKVIIFSILVVNLFASSYSSYVGNSGQEYQYDSSRYDDRIKYNNDLGAQQRDREYNTYRAPFNSNNNQQRDRDQGQYGMGIYN